jgi:hypothetical protein
LFERWIESHMGVDVRACGKFDYMI